MKATLEFDLPEDEGAYKMCSQAVDAFRVLEEFDSYLRKINKWPEEGASEEIQLDRERIRDKLFDVARQYNISW